MQKLVNGELIDLTSEEIAQRETEIAENQVLLATQDIHNQIAEQQKLLNDTDWYITRSIETDVPVPINITDDRVAARTKIDELRLQLGA